MAKTELVEFELKDNETILVEVAKIEGLGVGEVGDDDEDGVVKKAKQTFDKAIANIKPMISSIKEKIDDIKFY